MHVRLSKSIVDLKEASAVRRILLEDGYLGMGQEVRLFEEELGRFLGRGQVVCVNSGTAALHLAVMAVVKKDQEVLIPSLTFVASFQAVTAAGAVPVACDIDAKTLLIDLEDAARRLTAKTRAIMPVHYSGGVGNLHAVYAFARKHHLRVIEDAAHAFGTTYRGKRIGSFGDIVCFSFDGIKNITSAEGGAVVSNDRKVTAWIQDARLLGVHKDTLKRYQGKRSWEFQVSHQGYRYHMSNLCAAIGRVQLKKFLRFAKIRQSLAVGYQKALGDIKGIEILPRDFHTVVPHIFPILVKNGRRDALRAFLETRGIETGIHYYPNHWLKFFAKKNVDLPVTDKVYGEIFKLAVASWAAANRATKGHSGNPWIFKMKKIKKEIFNGVYRGKRVLVTGHTGFKGAWLSLWLTKMGADVAGFSKYLPSKPCLFNVLDLEGKIKHHSGDIIHYEQIQKVFKIFKPQIVFHLAAQPIVRRAYQDPKKTFDTNLGGTVNVLECVRQAGYVQAVVIITSDKCYENIDVARGYEEDERLGGADPYSASKACAEIAFSAYYRSFFGSQDKTHLATGRAGNVIGGGDWAKDRIVPDCVRAWSQGKIAIVRNPRATRPWQHVLEPLSGYLWLAACLLSGQPKTGGDAFNFGPFQRASHDVGELADVFVSLWGKARWQHVAAPGKKKEALLLQLSPRKTHKRLGWRSALTFQETVEFTAAWYKAYYERKKDMAGVTFQQIDRYVEKARALKIAWAGK